IDLTAFITGPLASMILGDQGAEVIKIEPPGAGDVMRYIGTARGGIWIVRRHEIDYHQPALPGEEVLEETWISSLRGARSVRNARFTRVKDGARLVSAVTQWAYVDVRTQRPRRIDPEILEAFEVLQTAP
ncbi:MAG: CoA transferase, partial [Deltaproteobacteria bacterium]|nr:CoA transferase [Deltaproteobacteria bacterium]